MIGEVRRRHESSRDESNVGAILVPVVSRLQTHQEGLESSFEVGNRGLTSLNHLPNDPLVAAVFTPTVVEWTSTIGWESISQVSGYDPKLDVAVGLGHHSRQAWGAKEVLENLFK
jgi:hypothetical protein